MRSDVKMVPTKNVPSVGDHSRRRRPHRRRHIEDHVQQGTMHTMQQADVGRATLRSDRDARAPLQAKSGQV